MKKLLIIFILIFSLFTAGCPKGQKSVRKARELSAQMQIYGIKLIEANIASFKANEITQNQLAELNKGTALYVKAIDVYRAAIREAETIVNSGKPLPAGTLNQISVILNSQVVEAFFDIMERLKIIPGAMSETVKNILAGIRLTILALQGVFAELIQMEKEQWT